MLQVKVQVEANTFPTKNGGRMQEAYVDTGLKYPELVKLFCRNNEVITPGPYYATKIKKKGFDFVLDLDNLTPAKAEAK